MPPYPQASKSVPSISSELNLFGGLEVAKGAAVDVAYSRFGISTDAPAYITTADDLLISGDLDVIGTDSFNIASASSGYFGSGLPTCTTAGSSALTWSAGFFGCNTITSGSSFNGIEVGDSAGTQTH